MTAQTAQPISARIAARIAELEALTLADNATPEQRAMFSARVERLSVLIGGLRNLLLAQQSEANDAEGISPLDPRLVLVHLAAQAGPDASAKDLADAYRRYLAAVELVAGAAAPAPANPQPPAAPLPPATWGLPAGLLPFPMPPMEPQPPRELGVWAPYYLHFVGPEMAAVGVPVTLAEAEKHWRLFGRPQGRRWRPDAPPPAWGPAGKDAPPGTVL